LLYFLFGSVENKRAESKEQTFFSPKSFISIQFLSPLSFATSSRLLPTQLLHLSSTKSLRGPTSLPHVRDRQKPQQNYDKVERRRRKEIRGISLRGGVYITYKLKNKAVPMFKGASEV
jgi:hypothetical protein